jgi:hypothetical protein
MAEYVHKLKVGARLQQPGEEPLDGFLSLAPTMRFREGPETLLERLNALDRVIPFHLRADQAVLLVNRVEIAWVAAGPGVGPERICPASYRVTREERVRLRLRDGTDLEGLLRMEMPEWYNRASDFMNADEDFFPLVTDAGIVLVNKRHVASTRLFETSPAPAA